VRPNPSFKRSAAGRPPGPGTFSPTGPWRPAVVARLTRTLGRTSVRTRGARCNGKRCIGFVLLIVPAVRFLQFCSRARRARRPSSASVQHGLHAGAPDAHG
jgi:hypothetical protein